MAALHSDDETYSSVPVPEGKKQPWPSIFFAAIGISTALIYMQVSSIISTSYGFDVAVVSIIYSTVLSSFVGYGLAKVGIESSMGTSLLANYVFGNRGSAVYCLVFGFVTIVYFSAEAAIMGASVQRVFPSAPPTLTFSMIVLAMIPLVWFGMKWLSRFQTATFFLYGILLLAALYISLTSHDIGSRSVAASPTGRPDFLHGCMLAMGIMNGIIFSTALVIADYSRFIARRDILCGSLFVGAGFQATCFTFSGVLGLWFSQRTGEANPGIYFTTLLGGFGVIFAVATQMRINLANMYSGSLAFVNGIRQLTGAHIPVRAVIILFAVAACMAFKADLADKLATVLTVTGMFTTCFACLLLSEFFIVRKAIGATATDLPPSLNRLVVKKAWHGPGLSSAAVATTTGCLVAVGFCGSELVPFATLLAAFLQVSLHVALSVLWSPGPTQAVECV